MTWDATDFIVFGALVMGVVGLYTYAARRAASTVSRFAVGTALVTAFFLLWVNGAVGIIGDESHDANLMYVGVLAVALVGAFIARFRPLGMARALVATALAQALVAAIALVAGWGSTDPSWPQDIVFLTGFFAALWLLSAALFRKAASEERDMNIRR